MDERLSAKYDGGIATDGKLDFYEFGRASYGFARFIATIETFRKTGVVPRKIVHAHKLGIIIEASERGSFPIDIIVPVALSVANELAKVPIDILVQYVISQVQRILPREETAILEAAEVQARIERERTKQSKEETKRIEAIAEMVKDQNVTHRIALGMIKKAQQDNSKALRAFDDLNVSALREKLELMDQREKAFTKHLASLEAIPSEKLSRLTSKVRPQLAETGLPLRRSANVMYVTSGKERRVIARFNEAEIKDINGRDLDEEDRMMEASFRAYDRDTGIGKLDLPTEDLRRLTFSVPPGDRTALRPKILKAIDEDAVVARLRFFKDKSGTLTSAIIQDINEDI